MPLRYSVEFDDPFCVAFPSLEVANPTTPKECYTELAEFGDHKQPPATPSDGATDVEDPENKPRIHMFSSSLHHAANYEVDYGQHPQYQRQHRYYADTPREPHQCVLRKYQKSDVRNQLLTVCLCL